MKNFLTALASALLVAVIVTSLHYFVFSTDMDRAPVTLLFLCFIGMAAVALFNVRLAALRSGLSAAPALDHTQGRGAGNRSRDGRASAARATPGAARAPRGDKKDSGVPATKSRTASSSTAAATGPPAAPLQPADIPHGPRQKRTEKCINPSTRFGFIVRPNGEEIFVHHRSIRNSDETRRSNLRDGQEVDYVVADHSKGQQAEDVVGE